MNNSQKPLLQDNRRRATMIVRGLSPTATTILFLLMWAAMFVFMRYVAPKATKDGIKLVAISFAAATAGLIVTAIAFALIAAFN